MINMKTLCCEAEYKRIGRDNYVCTECGKDVSLEFNHRSCVKLEKSITSAAASFEKAASEAAKAFERFDEMGKRGLVVDEGEIDYIREAIERRRAEVVIKRPTNEKLKWQQPQHELFIIDEAGAISEEAWDELTELVEKQHTKEDRFKYLVVGEPTEELQRLDELGKRVSKAGTRAREKLIEEGVEDVSLDTKQVDTEKE